MIYFSYFLKIDLTSKSRGPNEENNNNNNTNNNNIQIESTSILPSAESMPEILNRKALQVINRVNKKLTGRDFGKETLDIPEQVQRLIVHATSHENLCQCYIGWCPFW